MTFNPADYHPDWVWIRQQILDQAGHQCEWCGAPNGAVGDHDTGGRWHDLDDLIHPFGIEDWADAPGYLETFDWHSRPVKVILTTAHACQDKACIDPCHLFALCQRCHLNYDRDHHLAEAAETRRRRRVEAGQLELVS